ncbi:MAG: alpha/beta hydrolase [Bacteroidales bacterium]|jgi:pimeloyl-ACP methyl ester carboxylesterase|nr:alpha/beta hydrolase [Bacteroidales bacterium]
MVHRQILFEGKKINYQDEGAKESIATVVFLHGFMNDLDIWHYYVRDYMKLARVIAIDLLGHGESEIVSDVHTMELQAEMVKAVLDQAEVSNCMFIGHSMGGYIALAFAQMFPDYVKGICLLHSHSLPDREDQKQERYRVNDVVRNNASSFIVNFIPNLFAKSNAERLHTEIENIKDSALKIKGEAIIAAEKGMALRTSKISVLSQANFPVLFILGKQDTRIPVELAFAQAMLPAQSEVLLLENVGHMAHIEEREIIKRRLWSFIVMCYHHE